MKNLVFLDLEETVIDDWSTANLLPRHVQLVRHFLSDKNAELGLMSWAVWDLRDMDWFNAKMREALESSLGQTFNNQFVWSMQRWADLVFMNTGKFVAKDDLFELFGKTEVLFALSRHAEEFTGKHVWLLDDKVDHELTWHCKQNDCTVTILNIKEMLKVADDSLFV